jgi:hypothetical protein
LFITGCSVSAVELSSSPIRIFVDDDIDSFDIEGDNIAIIGGEKQHDWAVYLYNIKTQELKQITYDNSRKFHVKIENNTIYTYKYIQNPR